MKEAEIKIALDIYLQVYPVFSYNLIDGKLIIENANTYVCIEELDNIWEIVQIHDSLGFNIGNDWEGLPVGTIHIIRNNIKITL